MKTMLKTLIFGTVIALPGAPMALAQTPDTPDRKENTRQREEPARAYQPPERNNEQRIDPLMSAELQKCYAVPEAEKEKCIVEVKRKFGEM